MLARKRDIWIHFLLIILLLFEMLGNYTSVLASALRQWFAEVAER